MAPLGKHEWRVLKTRSKIIVKNVGHLRTRFFINVFDSNVFSWIPFGKIR